MTNADVIYGQFDFERLSRPEQIDMLEGYYRNNDLYESNRILKYYLGVWNEDIRPLRTPVQRSTEFYVSKIAIGEPVVASKDKNQALTDAVNQILEWSNFQIVKPSQIFKMALYGDLFRKAVVENGKTWHEAIETRDVTDFTEDTRGFLTSIRIDTPIEVDGVDKVRTEYWTVLDNLPYMAIWEHLFDVNTPLDQLGDPIMYKPLSRLGIDFIPFTRSPFHNSGRKWGDSCVQHALLKVDEANRQATRLHQILYRYNKPTWLVSANQVLDDGTPVPAPKLSTGNDIEKRDNSIIYAPGQSSVDSLIPNIDYKAALEILLSQEKELEKDLPELLYYSLPERADMSGKAIRTLLGGAIDRAKQAEANFTEGTVRLNQMAITIGQFQGIFEAGLGTFDSGRLSHSIRFADPFPMDIQEQSTTLKILLDAGVPMKIAMQKVGYSEEEIDEALVLKEKESPPPPATNQPVDMSRLADRMMNQS